MTGVGRVGAGMSSALWLTPPHANTPNALLAHEVGLPALPGKGGKGSFNCDTCLSEPRQASG